MNPEETPTPRFRRIHCVDVDLSEVAAGDETDVLLAPWGTYPQYQPHTGKTVRQVVDHAAANAMAAAFDAAGREVLVDADHGSENGGSSEAFAEEHKDKCDKTVLANAYKASPDTARALVLTRNENSGGIFRFSSHQQE